MTQQPPENSRARTLVLLYPFGVLVVGMLVNGLVFGIEPLAVALPSAGAIVALAIAAVLLVINHSWLMTATELTRVRHGMYAAPEEWAAAGRAPGDAPAEGVRELERRHNAHRNTTENTVYFAIAAAVFLLVSPPVIAAQVWFMTYAIARLGYTASYLVGNTGLRGLFMTLTLLPLYAMAAYPVMALFL